MRDEYLKVVRYMAEHGELMKAYQYLLAPPAYIEEDKQVLNLRSEVYTQLDRMKQFQDKGSVDGLVNVAFHNPTDIRNLVAFQHLQRRLLETGIDFLVDVGCYSGWMGRELSIIGVKVHGIDVHPMIMQIAAFKSAGTLATFEFLPIQKLGYMYPKRFGGAILFDVLEHVFDPELALRSVNKAVKDGGRIFINLPHPQGEHDSRLKAPIEDHEHLHAFSEKRIKELMPNAEIKVLENEGGSPNYFIEYVV